MQRSLPLGLALVAALLLPGCGSSNPKLIPQDRADQLIQSVDDVASRTSDSDCCGAKDALRDARNQVSELPRSVDSALKRNLNQWLDQIDEQDRQRLQARADADGDAGGDRDADRDADRDRDADARRRRRPRRRPRRRRRRRRRPATPTVEPPDTGGVVPGDDEDG